MTTVVENSVALITASFKDETGAAYAPSSVEWRLDNVEDGSQIVDWTAIASGSTVNITVPPANNVLQSQDSISERRVITVRADNGLATQSHQSIEYKIINALGVA